MDVTLQSGKRDVLAVKITCSTEDKETCHIKRDSPTRGWTWRRGGRQQKPSSRQLPKPSIGNSMEGYPHEGTLLLRKRSGRSAESGNQSGQSWPAIPQQDASSTSGRPRESRETPRDASIQHPGGRCLQGKWQLDSQRRIKSRATKG